MNKQIFRFAIPTIISNISVPLPGAVDTAFVGYLDAVYYLGALAMVLFIVAFIMNLCIRVYRISQGFFNLFPFYLDCLL